MDPHDTLRDCPDPMPCEMKVATLQDEKDGGGWTPVSNCATPVPAPVSTAGTGE
jgi:hypothetical protein